MADVWKVKCTQRELNESKREGTGVTKEQTGLGQIQGNSKPCYRGVTVIKRTKLSRSKAEQDGQVEASSRTSQTGLKNSASMVVNNRTQDCARGIEKGTRTALGSCVLLLESVETKAQMSM